jgi:hypothetical protein
VTCPCTLADRFRPKAQLSKQRSCSHSSYGARRPQGSSIPSSHSSYVWCVVQVSSGQRQLIFQASSLVQSRRTHAWPRRARSPFVCVFFLGCVDKHNSIKSLLLDLKLQKTTILFFGKKITTSSQDYSKKTLSLNWPRIDKKTDGWIPLVTFSFLPIPLTEPTGRSVG